MEKDLALLMESLEGLEKGFQTLPQFERELDLDRMRAVLLEVAERMRDNYPYHHPFYAGQMLKPPHPIARLAYALSLWINPNNHALDGGRASSAMEKEAVHEIARMFGWETYLGHLCGGGTMANLEALWVSRSIHPGKKIVASSQAHYTHKRICSVLDINFQSIPCDEQARMQVDALESLLKEGDIGTVVVTMGTTATGSVDPLPEILQLQSKYGFRIHADAAYGGYFVLIDDLAAETKAAFNRLSQADSIAVDPHKHGLQPYGCGCILFKDPSVGVFYKHDSPYTYFSSSQLHLGEISLECSRPGASAVALWATQRLLPLVPGGQFSHQLSMSRKAAQSLFERLSNDPRFMVPFAPELDILVWAPMAMNVATCSDISRRVFDDAASRNLHLALANLPIGFFSSPSKEVIWDQDQITCLRSCLMKPEHLEWIDSIWDIISLSMDAVIASQ